MNFSLKTLCHDFWSKIHAKRILFKISIENRKAELFSSASLSSTKLNNVVLTINALQR